MALSFINYDAPLPKFHQGVDRYICPVCQNVLKNAFQTACGHRLCESCLKDTLKNTPVKCPANEEDCIELTGDPQETFPDQSARREVGSLTVYCSNEANGCEIKLPWKKLAGHEAECVYVKIPCPNAVYGCRSRILAKDKEEHLTSCEFTPEKCPLCNTLQAAAQLQTHQLTECSKASITCPWGCGETLLREEEESHKNSCKIQPKECELCDLGCKFAGTGKSIEDHNHDVKSIHRHIVLLREQLLKARLDHARVKSLYEDEAVERQKLEQIYKVLLDRNSKQDKIIESLHTETRQLHADLTSIKTSQKKVENVIQSSMPSKDVVTRHENALMMHRKDMETLDTRLKNIERDTTRIVPRHRTGNTQEEESVRDTVEQHDRQIGVHDIRLSEYELRFQCLETTSYDGVLVWRLKDYKRRKHEAVTGKMLSLYSQPFYTHRYGYKMCARVYLNGDGMGKGSHISVFFVVMKGDFDSIQTWPFQLKVTLMVLDQTGSRQNLSDTFRPDPNSSSFRRPVSDMNIAAGCPIFASHQTVESSRYLKDDSLFIKVVVNTHDLSEK